MKIKKIILQMGVAAGVILGMKYVFPVMLPFLMGWILAEAVHPLAKYMAGRIWSRKMHIKESGKWLAYKISCGIGKHNQ